MVSGPRDQFKYLRNQNWHWESQPDTNHQFIHKMNLYGFRDKEWTVEKKHGKKRILFIGDSFVEGIMAEQDETIPKAFEKALNDNDYEVWNGGMVGSGPTSYLRLAVDAISIFKPDYVIICLYSNDLAQTEADMPVKYITPEYYNKCKPRLLELIQQIKLERPIKFRWNFDTETYIPAQRDTIDPWYVNREKAAKHVEPWLIDHMINGTLAPFRVNYLYTEKIKLGKAPELGEIVPFFSGFCKKFGVEPIIAYIPSKNVVTKYYYQFDKEMCLSLCNDSIDLTTDQYLIHQNTIAEECTKYGVTFFDLTENVRLRESVNEHLYWRYDEHMNAKGYEHIGYTIYQQWVMHYGIKRY